MFIEKLKSIWTKNNSLVCVGLDTRLDKIPKSLRNLSNPLFEFNKAIIESTADMVCAYKPQIAYYAAQSAENELKLTIDFIHKNYPDVPVILDAKRNDIGATAEQYAEEAFVRFEADAVTISPYMGFDSIEPFTKYKDKGVIVLCRTSNPGAIDLQDLKVDGMPLYQKVAHLAKEKWNHNNNLALVVGATYPDEMKEIRKIVGDMPFLVPGIGAQGGDVESCVLYGKDSQNQGLMMNSSRGVIYASSRDDFAEASRNVVSALKYEINQYL